MPFLTAPNWQISWTPLLVLGYLFYLLLGAMVFQLLEKQAETHSRDQFHLEKLKFLQNYTCLDRQALEQFIQVRGAGFHYFGSSIIFVRSNVTIVAKHIINWSAVHNVKGLTVQQKGNAFSSPFVYHFILAYSWTPKKWKSVDAPSCYLTIIPTSWFVTPSLSIAMEFCMERKTSQKLDCPSKALQPKPMQIVPFLSSGDCLLPMNVSTRSCIICHLKQVLKSS